MWTPVLPVTLPIALIPAGTLWWRTYGLHLAAIYFDTSSSYRFNAPDATYGACYFGITDDAAFVEAMLRGEPPTRLLTMKALRERGMAEVRVTNTLRLVPAMDQQLTVLGITADISSSRTYERSQAFARTVWGHPDQPDGILYRCRHDNSQHAVALFDRARASVDSIGTESIDTDTARLLRWRDRYRFALAP